MPQLTWLHLSDLHWRVPQAYNASIVFDKLLQDLQHLDKISPALRRIDLIFVTGDIAFSGQPFEYFYAQKFLRELSDVTHVPKNRVFIVPGNHDVQRDIRPAQAAALLTRLTSRDEVNSFLNNASERATLFERFQSYRLFISKFKFASSDPSAYWFVAPRKINGINLAVAGLHSAWLSQSDADRNHLLLGERQVRDVIARLPANAIRIALVHHPMDWLHDFDRRDCEPLLLRHFDFILRGHLHEPGLSRLRGPGSDAMLVAAGAAFEKRESYNSYNLMQLDLATNTGTLFLRVYSDKQGGFWTADTLTYPDIRGEFPFDLPADWEKKSAPQAPPPSGAAPQAGTPGTPDPNASPTSPLAPVAAQPFHGDSMDQWWQERGYLANPFKWDDAASLDAARIKGQYGLALQEVLARWDVEPTPPSDSGNPRRHRGETPVFDNLLNVDRGGDVPVLVYASRGGGKTFYAKWMQEYLRSDSPERAVLLIEHYKRGSNDSWTAAALAEEIYWAILGRVEDIGLQNPHHILNRCVDLLQSRNPARLFVVLDRLHVFFRSDRMFAPQNVQRLEALADFCREAYTFAPILSLRMFLPKQLCEPMTHLLGSDLGSHIHQQIITWHPARLEELVERRLDSCWRGGMNTRLEHLSQLLAPEVRQAFAEWLAAQPEVTPRCVIRLFDALSRFACELDIGPAERMDFKQWQKFIASPSFPACPAEPLIPLV